MIITKKGKDVILTEVKDFSVSQTLECGQCFHFDKLAENEYVLVHEKKLLHISQVEERITFHNTTIKEYEDIWKGYFDLERDYGAIKDYLVKKDERLKSAIEAMWGVRILNQNFFETLISFIISQNKQIPHIKQIVSRLSMEYGELLGEIEGRKIYSFPTCEDMMNVTEDMLRECKTGFRAPYIKDAVNKVASGELISNELMALDETMCRQRLTSIKGVGDKVANCTMLFSLGFRAAFPVDVWIKRIMEVIYFGSDTKHEQVEAYGKELFGEYSGYAQQYLFYYGRQNGIGKNGIKDTG